jgi:hypothetical protein
MSCNTAPRFRRRATCSWTPLPATSRERYTEKGEAKVASEHFDFPPDIANGITQTLLKNVRPGDVPASFAYVAAMPKPRLIKLAVSVAGQDRFASGTLRRTATHYVLKVELGGISGVVAPIIGKQPPDSHVWILGGETPAFVRGQQPFFSDAPLWTIDLASPQWVTPRSAPASGRTPEGAHAKTPKR